MISNNNGPALDVSLPVSSSLLLFIQIFHIFLSTLHCCIVDCHTSVDCHFSVTKFNVLAPYLKKEALKLEAGLDL